MTHEPSWLLDPSEMSLEAIKAEIIKRTLNEPPNAHAIPVHKAQSTVEILAAHLASDELSDQDKRLLDDVFTLAFSQPD